MRRGLGARISHESSTVDVKVGGRMDKGRPLSPHPNTSPWVLVLRSASESHSKMRSAPGVQRSEAGLGEVARTKRRAERHEKHSMHGGE